MILNSIDRDGTYAGYDLEIIKAVANKVNIPVVAAGGAAGLQDFYKTIKEGSACSGGPRAVFCFSKTTQSSTN